MWPVLVLVTVCVASGNTIEAPFMPPALIAPDKVAHLAVFGLIATLIYRALPEHSAAGVCTTTATPKTSRNRIASSATLRSLIAIGLTASFGISDEIHQSFTPSRTFDWYDFAADVSGAVIAVCAYRWFHPYRRALEWRLLPCPQHKAKKPKTA